MKQVCVVVSLILASCASGSAVKEANPAEESPSPNDELVAPQESVEDDTEADEPEETQPADTTVECLWGAQTNSTFNGQEYINVQVSQPCDVLTVHIETVVQIDPLLRVVDDASAHLGHEKVRLTIGREASVYESMEALLSDPAAGAEAAAVLPKSFDFEAMALARYDVLHSRQRSCRDEMLRLTGKQAEALKASRAKWRKRAQELANEWRFVPDAVDTVRHVHVIDPVLPAERIPPVTGPCQEFWISQPALTPVPRETDIHIFLRHGQ